MEVCVRDEGKLIRKTTEEEIEWMGKRVVEARFDVGGRSSSATAPNYDEEEIGGE